MWDIWVEPTSAVTKIVPLGIFRSFFNSYMNTQKLLYMNICQSAKKQHILAQNFLNISHQPADLLIDKTFEETHHLTLIIFAKKFFYKIENSSSIFFS